MEENIRVAAKEGKIKGLRELLENATPDQINQVGRKSNIVYIKKFFKTAENHVLLQPDSSGRTSLHLACESGTASCVRLLLDSGADARAVDKEGGGSITAAAAGGTPEVVEMLLEAGCQVDERLVDGTTPLFWAVVKGNTKVAK